MNNFKIETILCCPICHSQRGFHWTTGHDLLHKISSEEFHYIKCRDCDLVYLKNRVSELDSGKLYPDEYDPYKPTKNFPHSLHEQSATKEIQSILINTSGNTKLQTAIGKILKKLFRNELNDILTSIYTPSGPNKTILDFGCGSDLHLNWARSVGWDTIGVDFNEKAIKTVTNSGHKGIVISNDPDMKLVPDNSVDLIRLNHVIEHLYHPQSTLTTLKKKLRPNGIVHLSTPNQGGVSANKFRQFWRGLECPRHIMLYSPRSIIKLMSLCGFDKIKIFHEDNPKDYVRSLGYSKSNILNASSEQIETLFQCSRLYKKYYPITKIAALNKRGDRIHIIAHREKTT